MKLDPRERAILEYIHAHQTVTISEIAKHLKVSNKTVSNTLKAIDFSLKGSDVVLIRKPNVGVSLKGSDEAFVRLLEAELVSDFVPETQQDRLAFIVFSLLKKKEAISKQTFIQQLFISKSTLEKDLTKVKQILEELGATLTVISKKG
ncbi:MAG TPA: transcriptional antiterminator, partial [Lactococcus sp.]|nr:transcriptional antiterminator [Lactococcus sp.]